MFKDPDKQREANRKAQAKFKAKGIAEGITNQGITDKGITEGLGFIAKAAGEAERAKPKRGKDVECWDDLPISEQKALLVRGNVQPKRGKDIKPQSYNSMMVGYVPPREI